MQKKTKNRGRKSDAYLANVCRLPQNIESIERIDKNQRVLANAVSFVNCRSRLTIMPAGAARV